MLQREFWKSVAENQITDEVMAYAQERFDKLVAADADKIAEREEIQAKIVELLVGMDGEKTTAKEVAEQLDVSTQKASYHLSKLAKDGMILGFDGKPKEYSSLEGENAE